MGRPEGTAAGGRLAVEVHAAARSVDDERALFAKAAAASQSERSTVLG